MRTICEVALCRVVGSAEPHPNICTSNGSIVSLYSLGYYVILDCVIRNFLLFYEFKT